MNTRITLLSLLFILIIAPLSAQNTSEFNEPASTSDYLVAQPFADRTVTFDVAAAGESKPIIWGLDLAWRDANNLRRGLAFMGADILDVFRSSFMPTDPLVGDTALQGDALRYTNERLSIINQYLPSHTKIVLNCDHPSVHSSFKGNPQKWADLIEITTRMHQDIGREVITVSPFNEPDYSATGQGTIQDFYDIAEILNNTPFFDNIRISGGNTLNNDVAFDWYHTLRSQLDEGNTHQLAGSFDTYAAFYEAVRNNNHHATNDELHNVMEAMVGVEYGLQTGIWWGTAEYARGEFCKASNGVRLGYAEHRPNWTAASVYRHPDGKVQAFGGTSERQATNTSYQFISTNRDVYFDGKGPQRWYMMELPGGTGYQQGQTNAENVVNISWDDDIQPVINGQYIIVNRNSGKVMMATSSNIQQRGYSEIPPQHWEVKPVSNRIGGDFSYFTIKNMHNGKVPDILNWSLDNGENIIAYDDTKGGNQQWYLDYAGDGWFYIRSRHNAKCMEVAGSNTTDFGNVQQWDVNGGANQQWRFLPVGTEIEFNAPLSPQNLTANSNAVSIGLNWAASEEQDVTGYHIFRSESEQGEYHTIAQNVQSTAFVDNTVKVGKTYYYSVKAIDQSLNRSDFSKQTSGMASGENASTMHLTFDGTLKDSTQNLFHAASFNEATYGTGKIGEQALTFNGSDDFLQLAPTVCTTKEITVSTWVYITGGAPWQRIFEFSRNETSYMYLSTQMRFGINNNSSEQRLSGASLPKNKWVHVAVTLQPTEARMYVDGEIMDESNSIDVSPADILPIQNYIGKGLATVSYFNGKMDDFRIYNFALSSEEIKQLADVATHLRPVENSLLESISVYPNPANNVLHIRQPQESQAGLTKIYVYDLSGKIKITKNFMASDVMHLDMSPLQNGIYMLQYSNGNSRYTKRVIVRH